MLKLVIWQPCMDVSFGSHALIIHFTTSAKNLRDLPYTCPIEQPQRETLKLKYCAKVKDEETVMKTNTKKVL